MTAYVAGLIRRLAKDEATALDMLVPFGAGALVAATVCVLEPLIGEVSSFAGLALTAACISLVSRAVRSCIEDAEEEKE